MLQRFFTTIFACSLAGYSQFSFAAEHLALENVLGTSLRASIHGTSQVEAERALFGLREELNELEQILSTWRENSDVSQLNATKTLFHAPEHLVSVLQLCQSWFVQSGGHFSCRMGQLIRLWQKAEKHQQVPERVATRKLARSIHNTTEVINIAGTQVSLSENIELDIAGVAKGYIIDQAMLYLRKELPSATGIKLNIGGDVKLWGTPARQAHWQVGVDLDAQSVNQIRLELTNKAIAVSGHSARFFDIQRRKFSHILEPEQGWPKHNAPTAVVLADDAATADAVATALTVQSASAGIDWVNNLPGVEAMVQIGNLSLTSNGWFKHVASVIKPFAHGVRGIQIAYQIPRIKTGEYHRPYLAIWVSDLKNNAVRHLLLLGESQRWAKENARWWRRAGRKLPGVLDTVARPTRRPGDYQLNWFGLNDYGQPVASGEYWLHIEASREAGGHTYKKVKIDTHSFNDAIYIPEQDELGALKIMPYVDGILTSALPATSESVR